MNSAEMRIGKDTDPKGAAGYLAEHFIEDPFTPVRLMAIGQEAVFKAINTLIFARGVAYTNGFELNFVVERFQTPSGEDGELWTGVKFTVYPAIPRGAMV